MSGTVTTTRPVNLGQLAAALGGAELTSSTEESATIVTAHDGATTKAQLQAAVDAHVAIDERGNRATLEQRAKAAMAANTAYLARTSPTTAQTTAQVRVLTQECQALIRMALNLLDGTE